MSVKTDSELKAQLDSIIRRNDGGEIIPELDNALRTNFIDSKLSIKDGGNVLQAVIGYASSQTFNNPNQIPNISYVDTAISEAINDIDFSPFALLAGDNQFTEDNEFTKAIIATGGLDVFSGALNIGTTNANAIFIGRNGLSNLVITSDQLELDAGSSNSEVILYAGGLVTLKATDGFEITGDTKLINLTASTILELDASKNIISAAKGTAYNKDFGTTSGTVAEGNRIHPEYNIKNPVFYDELFSSTLWSSINSGGANGLSTAGVGDFGLVTFGTSTSSTGRNGIILGSSANMSTQVYLGQCEFTYICKIKVEGNLSDGTNTYEYFVGLNDTAGGDATDGVYFLYRQATHGNLWVTVTAIGGVRTTTVTDIPVTASSSYVLKAVVNSSGTEVNFYIDSGAGFVLASTHTTNIPNTNTSQLTPQISIQKTAGTSARFIIADFWLHYLSNFARI